MTTATIPNPKASRRGKLKLAQPVAIDVAKDEARDVRIRHAAYKAWDNMTTTAVEGRMMNIPPGLIDPSPFNPRQAFSEVHLQSLGESLRDHGQLQPCVVRVVGPRYELIAGERRWRAAQRVGMATVWCKVIEADDARAVELAGVENYQRSQLNAIEEARWFAEMIEKAGFTQQKLADRLSLSQGHVSNRLRLLDLPAGLRERIISGEMPATWARHLAAWTKRPVVLKAVEKEVAKTLPRSEGELKRTLGDAVEGASRPLNGWFYSAAVSGHRIVAFKPTAAQRSELEIESAKINEFRDAEDRCFNIALWEKLQAEGEAKAKARDDKRAQQPGKMIEGEKGEAQEAREKTRKLAA